MHKPIATAAVDRFELSVSDLNRARDFYINVLGFQLLAELPARLVLSNGCVTLTLITIVEPEQAIPRGGDQKRIGLDRVSFRVDRYAELERAVRLLDGRGIAHGEIQSLAPQHLYVLALRDPDDIRLELSVAYSEI